MQFTNKTNINVRTLRSNLYLPFTRRYENHCPKAAARLRTQRDMQPLS